MKSPFDVVRAFEEGLCEYTGFQYAVTVNSCTMALLLAVKWHAHLFHHAIEVPKRTYVSVPMSIIHAGGIVAFRDEAWKGYYQLKPLPVWDSARCFGKNMAGLFPFDAFVCVSFHTTKVLGDTQGGAILTNNAAAYRWLKRMRFDGRSEGVAPKDDKFTEVGYHCYLSPDVAARLLHKLTIAGPCVTVLPNDDYPDLSQLDIFK